MIPDRREKRVGSSRPCRMGRLLRLTLRAAAVSLLIGCANEVEKPAESGEEQETRVARSQVERGPVRVTVEVEPARARLSDEPTLTLTIDYQKGVTIQEPPFGESLGDFLIRDFREPLPEVRGRREIIRRIYTLEPARSGDLAVWPISVTFTDTRPDGDGQEHKLETEGLTIEVASVVEGDMPSLADLRPAAGPVELPRSRGAEVWWLVGVVLTTVAVAARVAWRWLRRRRAVENVAPLSPREMAYLELEAILEQGWAEQDVKRFYVELTGAVRRYIERTTGILAPEQTTEEFLREIGRRDTFSADERYRLRHFLQSADLVKFAAHQPRTGDVEESFRRAKAFVGLDEGEAAA